LRAVLSGPRAHLTSSPDSRMLEAASLSLGGVHRLPRLGTRVISTAGVQQRCWILATPDDNLITRPDGRMINTRSRCIANAGRRPTVICRIVLTAAFKINTAGCISNISTPYDHFRAGPHRGMIS